MWRAGMVAILALALAGCEGFYEAWAVDQGNGDSSSSTTSLDGIWPGTLDRDETSSPTFALAAVWDGKLLALSQNGDAAYAGAIAPASSPASGDLGEGDVRVFDGAGTAQDPGILSGTYAETDTLTVAIADTTSRDGQLDLTYDALFERGTALNGFVGSWSQTRDGQTLTLTVDSSFAITGSRTDGCNYSGDLAPLDQDRNLYRLILAIETCPDDNGDYTGLAYLDPDASPKEWVALAERNDEGRFWWARLEKQ